MNNDLRGKVEACDPAQIRSVFYQRVFNNPNPEVPQGEAAMRLVSYKDKVVTYGNLHAYLLGEIDDLVAFMTAPTEGSLREGSSSWSIPTGQYKTVETQPSISQRRKDRGNHSLDDKTDLTDPNSSRLASQTSQHLPSLSFGKIREEDFTMANDSDLRVQTRLGDPATADFSPIDTYKPHLSKYHRESCLDHESHLYSFPPPTGLQIDRQALDKGRRNSHFGNSQSKQLTHLVKTNTDLPADHVQPTSVTEGQVFNRNDSASGIRPRIVPVENEINAIIRYPSNSDRNRSGSHRVLPRSSQSFHVEHPFQSRDTILHSHSPQYDYAPQYQPQLFQAPTHIQTPDGSLIYSHPENLAQGQGFHRSFRQFENIPFSRQHSGCPPAQFSTGLPQNPGLLSHSLYGQPHQTQTWFSNPMNAYEHKMHSPYIQNDMHESYNEISGNGIPTIVSTNRLYPYGTNSELHTSSFPIAASISYVQPYIPADKYARAPAPNRLASRFAQIHPHPPLQGLGSFNITPQLSPRASLTTLPYYSGSNDMFPIQQPGLASIRYQALTRNDPPRFSLAGDEGHMPFVETTKLSKAAEWGILKISNVSLSRFDIKVPLVQKVFLNEEVTPHLLF